MGSIYLGQILTSFIAGRQPAAAPDSGLDPIVPGAWAAWAKAARDEAAATLADTAPTAEPLPTVLVLRHRGAGR